MLPLLRSHLAETIYAWRSHSLRVSQELQLDGAHDRASGAMHVQLAVEVLDMCRDRVQRNAETLGGLRVGATRRDEPQDLRFASG